VAPDWLIWQLADSTFPAGGFAHSGGLEAVWQAGLLGSFDGFGKLTAGKLRTGDASELSGLLRSSLRQTARGAAPFVAATCLHPSRFDHADELCDAVLSNHVANRASRSQGQAYLAAASRVFTQPAIRDFAAASRSSAARRRLHFGPVFGVVAAGLGLDAPAACSLFLFLSLRSLVSAAVRLGIVGPLQGQSIQTILSSEADDLVRLATSLTIDDVAMTTPLLDLAQATHDRLYSRLFQS
jgi:urease accessory protein